MPQNKSLDVLFLSHRYQITSGGEKSLLELIEYLVSINKSVHVIIGDRGDITQHLDALGVTYSIVHNPFWARGGEDLTEFTFDQPWNPQNNTVVAMTDIIRNLNPKLCVTNTIVTPWLAYAAAITSTPHAWMVHELHSDGLNLRYAINKEQVLKTIDILSDAIFYSSRYTASTYTPHMQYNTGVNIVFPAGVGETPRAAIASPFTTKGLKIISVGQIKEQKGQIDTVRAAIELKASGVDFQVVFVGGTNDEDEQYRNTLYDLVAQNELSDCVTFTGHSSNPQALMQYADISINAATNETFGRVTVEGMACGTVVIGAKSAGTAEIITSEAIGFLYEPGNSTELARILKKLHNNPSLVQKITKTAKKHAFNTYSNQNRFKDFVTYLDTNPARRALDLSPLSAVTNDFRTLASQQKISSSIRAKIPKRLKRAARRALRKS